MSPLAGLVVGLLITAAAVVPALAAVEAGAVAFGGTTYSSDFAKGVRRGIDRYGGHYSVVCPAEFPKSIGSIFTCTATDTATKRVHTLTVEVMRGPGGGLTARLLLIAPRIAH